MFENYRKELKEDEYNRELEIKKSQREVDALSESTYPLYNEFLYLDNTIIQGGNILQISKTHGSIVGRIPVGEDFNHLFVIRKIKDRYEISIYEQSPMPHVWIAPKIKCVQNNLTTAQVKEIINDIIKGL